ncbi:MAG: efflux transporter outer membrane subunit [Pseudomonadota bacterium]|nr:efflux transporter outer membrane subunit [Pseudomonadota bacterium]
MPAGSQGELLARAVGLAATLMVAACADLAPPYQRPVLPVPEQYADAAATPDDALSVSVCWPEYVVDAQLRALISEALANNRDLRVALSRVEEARASYGIQRAEAVPLVSANLIGSRTSIPAELNPLGRGMIGNQFVAGADLNGWELDFWGRVRNLETSALESYLASDAAARAARLSLITQVGDGYLALSELDERLALARRTLASRARSLQVFRRREQTGSASRLELTQVELLWRQAAMLTTTLAQQRDVQAHELAMLVGDQQRQFATTAPGPERATFRELQPGLPSDLLNSRPDVIAAEHGLKAATASIGAARAAYFPRIALTALVGTASPELDGLFRNGSAAWTVSPAVALPVLDGGRRSAAVDVARARQQTALESYQRTVQAAFRDVSNALSARRWLADQADTLSAMLALQTERSRLAGLRYESGAVGYLEVLDAERELLAAEQQLVQVRRALLGAQLALWSALGGGPMGAPGHAPPPCNE